MGSGRTKVIVQGGGRERCDSVDVYDLLMFQEYRVVSRVVCRNQLISIVIVPKGVVVGLSTPSLS